MENRRERERERARRSPTSKQEDRIRARRSHRSDHSNPSSSNPVTDHRDCLAISGPRAKRETERVERSLHHRQDCLAIVLEPARTRSPTNPLAPRRLHRRVTPRTQDRSTTNRESHHANRTGESHHEPVTDSFSFSFEIFVINFFCNFDFLLSL